jgi:hypothetical protein
MSILVELEPEDYAKTAFDAFDPAAKDFTLGNARAMMWLSQLAYETRQPQTISTVGKAWGFVSIAPFIDHRVDVDATFKTCGILGERPDAILLAFAGTDPAVWETVATDFKARPTADRNTHSGFQEAFDGARAEAERACELSRQSGKPLFITGHSLGAALAALAAQFAHEIGVPPKAVYTFGMPRVGGERFRSDYNGRLGSVTFRLVHGLDVVARVPPSEIGFRHVGRVLTCGRNEKFAAAGLSEVGSDLPDFADGVLDSIDAGIRTIASGRLLSLPGPGPVGRLFKYLPPPIRDHLQDRYYTALAP